MRVIQDIPKFAIFMGGTSAEREVSINSGNALVKIAQENALKFEQVIINSDYDVFVWLASNSKQAEPCSIVLIALHGGMGENGKLQSILDVYQMSYTGANAKACTIAMDKWITKQLFKAKGLRTPAAITVESDEIDSPLTLPFTYPVMVKPTNEGSSVGMAKVMQVGELKTALQLAFKFSKKVIIEQCISGREITVNFVGSRILPLIEIRTPRSFYDYEAKYQSDSTEYICPAVLPLEVVAEIKEITLQAIDVLEIEGWGRIDFMLSAKEPYQPYIIEINTVPGLTSHSLFPMSARVAGMTNLEWLLAILQN